MLVAERARWQKADSERNRIELSLRWFGQALVTIGVDSFLRYWFAIETLAMDGDTDIRAVSKTLASLYALDSPSAAREQFHVGLLFGLRSRIVHQGLLSPIDGRLLRYCEFLYRDLLCEKLGLPSERRLVALMSDRSFDYGSYIRSLTTAPD